MQTAVRHDRRMGKTLLTYAEIAAKYEKSESLVQQRWAKHPDWPPASPVKRGRALQFDGLAVDKVVREHFVSPPVELSGDPGELLTLHESYDVAVQLFTEAGRKPPTWDTVRGYDSRGQWVRCAGTRGGVRYFRRDAIAEYVSTRRKPSP